MSIAALKKVTLVGIANEKDIALSDLQNLGVIHLIDISNQSLSNSQKQADPFKDNHEALAFLESCTLQQRPLRRRPKQFQPDIAIAQVLRLKARTGQLRDEAESDRSGAQTQSQNRATQRRSGKHPKSDRTAKTLG